MKFHFLLFLTCLFVSIGVFSQNVLVPRDSSYTLENALKKAQENNKESDIHITAVNSYPTNNIKTENNIIYKKLNERELSANLFYPKKKNKNQRPGILIIHGGGWRSGDKSLMTPMAQRLADAGYFVMAPEYRLSLEAPYPAAVIDLYNALDWMYSHSEKYNIDTNRLVVMGCSAGGQLAALVGTTYNNPEIKLYKENKPGHIVAIIDVDGILAFKHPDSQEGKVASEWLKGTYEKTPENWEEASALNHVDQYTPSTLFLGSIYPRFLAGRQDYIQKLNLYDIYSETHFIDRAPHSFWLFNPWYKPTMKYILSFLNENLH